MSKQTDILREIVDEDVSRNKLIRILKKENIELRGRFNAPIVCICGSTRFKQLWIDETARLTMAGNIVLPVGVYGYYIKDQITVEEKVMLCRLHRSKIVLCTWVWVLNPNNYIGVGTAAQIEYAESLGRPVRYLLKEFPNYSGPLE